ncbi:MAG: stage II sporulation protein P [Limnochordia bacterium]|jgi:stage II sporulation protein P
MKPNKLGWMLIVLFIMAPSVWAQDEDERLDGGYYSLIDRSTGQVVTMTARHLDPGDTYISADNREYRVEAIDGDRVLVEFLGEIELPAISEGAPSYLTQLLAQDSNDGPIGLYHTHSAESYVPTSGTDSKETGDIFEVGKSFQQALEQLGLRVLRSDNNHNPHDGGAYIRSRRTVKELLQQGAVALFDIHRDAVPPEVYRTTINGEQMTKVRLVVGRQNPNRAANLEYAKRIKAVADKELPGIIEGIFHAKGNYNQDIGPRMMLLEMGAHTTSLEEAQKSAWAFARIIPAAAGFTPAARPEAARQLGGAGLRAVAWVLVLTLLAGIGFVALNVGSLEELKARLRGFFSREMVNALGLLRRRKRGEDDE